MENKPEKQVFYNIKKLFFKLYKRIIGNSSNLGLLIDHGCDAIVVTLGSINSTLNMRTGNDFWGFSLMM